MLPKNLLVKKKKKVGERRSTKIFEIHDTRTFKILQFSSGKRRMRRKKRGKQTIYEIIKTIKKGKS